MTAPCILIAGCGTGQHSIETATRCSNCPVTAVDSSLSRLAYAIRKTNELKLDNLEYLQADFLHLHQLVKKIDIIESSGVLYHMAEPIAGWRVLVDLLEPSALKKIGLYSASARQYIQEIRKEITARKIGSPKATSIRKFRKSLVESHGENHKKLTTSSDFFSLSALSNLIFYVQEHRFAFPQIKESLDELGLKFCGFENKDVISKFRESFKNEVDIYDSLWPQYEERNP